MVDVAPCTAMAMVTPFRKSAAFSHYEIPDDTPLRIPSENRDTPGLPSTSCARIREVSLKNVGTKDPKNVLQPLDMNGKNVSVNGEKPFDHNRATQEDVCMRKVPRMMKSSDSCTNSSRSISEMDISRVDDMILEHQLKYERLNTIMKETQVQIIASQDDRAKFIDAYNSCMKNFQDELFARESELFKCQQELEKIKEELNSTKAELTQIKEEQSSKEQRLEEACARACDEAPSLEPTTVPSTSLIEQQQHTPCSTLKVARGKLHLPTPSEDKENFIINSTTRRVNTSLADIAATVMSPRTPKGISRRSRRSSLYQFIAENTSETDQKVEILRETIFDLKEVLDCYATMTGLSITVDKSDERLNDTTSKTCFKVETTSDQLHGDFKFSLCIDDAYGDIEFTPTFMENEVLDTSLVQRLPSCLMEKFYFPAEEGILFLGDLLRFLKTSS